MEEVKALETRLILNRWMAVAYHLPHVCLFVVLTDYSFHSWIDLLTFAHFRMERTLAIGGSRGGTRAPYSPSLFLDQTEARGAEKFFLRLLPPASQGLDDRSPPPTHHRCLKVLIRHC